MSAWTLSEGWTLWSTEAGAEPGTPVDPIEAAVPGTVAQARGLGLDDARADSFSHDADGMAYSFDSVCRSASHLRRLSGRAAKLRAKDVLLDEVRRERAAERCFRRVFGYPDPA